MKNEKQKNKILCVFCGKKAGKNKCVCKKHEKKFDKMSDIIGGIYPWEKGFGGKKK